MCPNRVRSVVSGVEVFLARIESGTVDARCAQVRYVLHNFFHRAIFVDGDDIGAVSEVVAVYIWVGFSFYPNIWTKQLKTHCMEVLWNRG